MLKTTRFSFGTKAETLDNLKSTVISAFVPELVYFTLEEWLREKKYFIKKVQTKFKSKDLVIRSSALLEDQAKSSLAGCFESILSVPSSCQKKLSESINKVFGSMTGNANDQVLIQEMPKDISLSGVIMTFDVATGAPYFCIDFDDQSGRTDLVTSGNGEHKSLYVYRGADPKFIKSSRVASFLKLARELENICQCPALDIEFGMDSLGKLYLFQVRRIVLARNWHPVIERKVKRQLVHAEEYLSARSKRRGLLLGKRTIFAIMPDWNPAEIIGTTPRPLATSLYKHLITDSIWAEARVLMGYRPLGNTELMSIIGQHPYIDVRTSFNSFLPAGIPNCLGEKLVNAWLDRLEAYPELHDKIEFEIVPTSMDFSFNEDFNTRYNNILSDGEYETFKTLLEKLTVSILDTSKSNTLDLAIRESNKLKNLRVSLVSDDGAYAFLERAKTLLNSCKRLGTLSFAIAARHAFVAENILRSAVRKGALTNERLNEFKRTIRTINGSMLVDYAKVSSNEMDESLFQKKYGHLRPGTYEISSLRYDERDDLFQDSNECFHTVRDDDFQFTLVEREQIKGLLEEINLGKISEDQLLIHARKAIASREDIKFQFTKALSDAMVLIQKWGELNGLSRDDLSYLEWSELDYILTSPILDDLDRQFLDIAFNRRRTMTSAQALKFAHIISNPRDIYVATLNRSIPNFIGLDKVSGLVKKLEPNSPSNLNLESCIVCIENADPGFDWIFTKSIGALVTRFGGANSHMAVRCAELGVPAAIGCGDQIFNRISETNRAEINCSEQILRPIYV